MTREPADHAGSGSSDDGRSMDRRTRSRLRRIDRVYTAAIRLFASQGFDHTTMDEIAEAADVARATVFNYFPRKTTFLDEWTARRRARAEAAITGCVDKSLDQLLRRYMSEMATISEETFGETRALLGPALQQTNFLAQPKLADDLTRLITKAKSDGPVSGIEGRRVALILATVYFAVLDQWVTSDPPEFVLEHELHAVVDIILYGVSDD